VAAAARTLSPGVCAAIVSTVLLAQPAPAPGTALTGVRHIIGLETVQSQKSGSLSVQNNALSFAAGESRAEIPLASIDNIFVGSETTRSGGKPADVVAIAAPYGSGRLFSLLLRTKVDMLTVVYHDANGGVHGTIFATPKGQAGGVQTQLHSADATGAPPAGRSHGELIPRAGPPANTQAENSQANAKPEKLSASAIQIEPLETGSVDIPAEFRFAAYERLIERVRHDGKFQKVFRAGDREAESISDLVILRTTVSGFKPGSEAKREATTVAGSTTLEVTATVSRRDGSVLVTKSAAGRVRYFGENLGATNDLAKRIAKVLNESF
jgi:hypothetical protein